MNNPIKKFLTPCLLILAITASAQVKLVSEDDYYKIISIPAPEGVLLEVGGVASLPDGRIAVCTRRGDVWMIENPTMENSTPPVYSLFASGLHEPLGLLYKDDALYAAQRGELTKLMDTNGDGKADVMKPFMPGLSLAIIMNIPLGQR